jgi:hypothetical protein
MQVMKDIHIRHEYLGLHPESIALRESCKVLGNSVDHGHKDMFKGV